MKVYLAVGHGIRPDGTFDPGAVGGGWNEQTAGDHIVAEAAKLLRNIGHTVYSEAFQDDDPNFVGSTRKANEWGADVVVAVHHDWVGAPEGAFGHWYTTAGKSIADQIQQAVGDAGFELRPSWHKKRDDLYILKNTIAPCVLYEVGRIGTDALDTEAELRDMGRAIADGVAAWGGSPLPEGDEDVSKLQDDVDGIKKTLGDRKTRPSMWRDLDRTKQAAGRTEIAIQELKGEVASLRAAVSVLSSAGTAAGVNTAALADEILAEIKERL